MRIAISNLAWNVSDDEQIVSLLHAKCVDAIDIAPGKYFPDFVTTGNAETDRVRTWWADRGIEITGMQALLFGTVGLNIFAVEDVQSTMLSHLDHVCRIGAGLGAVRLVFGSPRNRDRSALDDEQTRDLAVSFFHRLGDIAERHGVTVCLEPNPPCYGANFMLNSAETAQVVMDVSHPAIRMQLDTGAMTINGENPFQIIKEHGALIGHVHASEPDLLALGDGNTDHVAVASALREYVPGQIVSIEMLPAKDEPNMVAIERALNVAVHHYRAA